MRKEEIQFYILNSTIALICGLIIYLFTRKGLYINDILGIEFSVKRNALSDFLSFYVTDGLWAYALFFMLRLMYGTVVSFTVSVSFGALWELSQLFEITNGTFDILDISAYIAADLLAVVILFFWRKNYEKNR